MALSENFQAVEAYRDYVQTYNHDLITEAFLGSKTLAMVTVHEGVKGRLTLTELVVGDLIKRYTKAFEGDANKLTYNPRHLNVVDASVELSVCPKDLEGNYLGALRQKGQNPKDWPFQRFIIDKILAKIKQEEELAVWRAVETGSPTATDGVDLLFDGYIKIIQDAVTNSELTPTVTGAVNATNAVASVEAVWSGLSLVCKDMPIDIFMSPQGRVNYFLNYREKYGKHTGAMGQDGSYKLDFANASIHGMAGIQNDSTIIITPRSNLHWGFDAPTDDQLINFEWDHRQLDMWIDFKIGTQIALVKPAVLAINDPV